MRIKDDREWEIIEDKKTCRQSGKDGMRVRYREKEKCILE